MQIWYLFKVSASEQIPLQHRKDGNKNVQGSNLTCKYGICSRFQPLDKYPYSTEKMQTSMYRDEIVSAE